MAKFIYLLVTTSKWHNIIRSGSSIPTNAGRFLYSHQVPSYVANLANNDTLVQLDFAVVKDFISKTHTRQGDVLPLPTSPVHKAAVNNFAQITNTSGINNLPEFYRLAIRQEVTRLHIFRSAKTEWHRQNRLVGRADSRLLESAAIDAERAALKINQLDITAAISSSSGRAIETRKLLMRKQPGVPAKTSPGLMEIHLGDIEGLTLEQAKQRHPISMFQYTNRPDVFVAPDGGESLVDVQKRSIAAVKKLARDYHGGNLLVVTHKTVIAALGCHFLEQPLKHAWSACKQGHLEQLTIAFKGSHAWLETGAIENKLERNALQHFNNLPNRSVAWG